MANQSRGILIRDRVERELIIRIMPKTMKIGGWVLLVVGLVATWYTWSSGMGAAYMVVSLVVAAAGLWLALRNDGSPSV